MDDPQDNGTDRARHPSGQAPAPSLPPPPPPTAQSSQAEAVASSQGIPDQPTGRFAQVGTANTSTASTRSRKRSRSPEDDPMQAFKRHARKVCEEIEIANRRSVGIVPTPSATEASKGDTSQSMKRPASRYTANPSSTSAGNPLKLGSDQTQEPVSKPRVVKKEPSPGPTATEQQLEDEILDTARALPSQPALEVTDKVTNVTNVTDVIRDMLARPSVRTLRARSIDTAVRQLPSQGPSPRMPQLPRMTHDPAVGREAATLLQPRITLVDYESDSDTGSEEDVFTDAQEYLT